MYVSDDLSNCKKVDFNIQTKKDWNIVLKLLVNSEYDEKKTTSRNLQSNGCNILVEELSKVVASFC